MHSKMVLLAQSVPEGRLFGLDGQTLISIAIQLLNGIILAVVLGFILYKPVKEFMAKRSDIIEGKIKDSDMAMEKANELIAVYNAKIKDIDKERLKILEAARLKAADESKEVLQAAKREGDEIKKRSLESIEADKKRFKEEMRLHVIEVAFLMAQNYISQRIDSEDQDRLFEDALAQLEDAKWQN